MRIRYPVPLEVRTKDGYRWYEPGFVVSRSLRPGESVPEDAEVLPEADRGA